MSGYSVTATASPALDLQSNTNTNQGGTASAYFDAGSGGPVTAIASATEADNSFGGQVYTSIGGGVGATTSNGSTLMSLQLTGTPQGSTTLITLTFSESAQIGSSPPTENGAATFDITSDFKLTGQTSGEATINAVGLYQNAQLSGSGSLTGTLDPLDSTKFDLFGTSTVSAEVSGNFVFQMTNNINVEVDGTTGQGVYNVNLTGVSLANSDGAAVSITPVSLTPVPLPGSLTLLLSVILGLLLCWASRPLLVLMFGLGIPRIGVAPLSQ